MDYRPAQEDSPGAETCPECLVVLAELDRLSALGFIPIPYRVREGSYEHLVASDHDYLCRYNFNRRRKKGGRQLMRRRPSQSASLHATPKLKEVLAVMYGPWQIVGWIIAVILIVWLLSAIF